MNTIATHDRRGHGRSTDTSSGNDMDTYAADVARLVTHLDLRDAIHVGHSTGGGEATRYVARHGKQRVAKLVLIGAVPPLLVKTPRSPDGIPKEVFDNLRGAYAANRTAFYRDVTIPFYGYNREGANPSEAVRRNWWRQAMIGGALAQYECVKAFSETDFTEDLQMIEAPVVILHGEDDQIVPLAASARVTAKIVKNGVLKTYPGLPHGMATTHADRINQDLLELIRR